LETKRLILRPTSMNDAEQMYAGWASDPEVTKYMTWQPHADIEVTKAILAEWAKESERPDYYHWGIVLKETGLIAGTCGTLGVNEKHQSAELGYCLSRTYWGKGYMSEAVAAMIGHLFNTVGLNRISSFHYPENIASGRVMEKCGMTFEGIQRQAYYHELYGFVDIVCYAILRSDFEKNNNVT